MKTATNILQVQSKEVRSFVIKWSSYFESHIISHEDYAFITAFDLGTYSERDALISSKRGTCGKIFINMLEQIENNQAVGYILVLISDMLQNNKAQTEIFSEHALKNKESIWKLFFCLLIRDDRFIVHMSAVIISQLATWSESLMEPTYLKLYIKWIEDQLQVQKNDYILSTISCLQLLLRRDEYRFTFDDMNGISFILKELQGICSFQVHYQLIFCIWIFTFNPTLAGRSIMCSAVIKVLTEFIKDCAKEKVVRITLAVFRNLIEKPENPTAIQDNTIAMERCKVLKQLELLEKQEYKDEDIIEDIKFLIEHLNSVLQNRSSFDIYVEELKSGHLELSPLHKSSSFWFNNVSKLNDNNYQLLQYLIKILQNSDDPNVLRVACLDVGQYVQHYSQGKQVMDDLGGKEILMQYLDHEDQDVRYEALLAVQKLMIHNWEYLGKMMQQENGNVSQIEELKTKYLESN